MYSERGNASLQRQIKCTDLVCCDLEKQAGRLDENLNRPSGM
jgi:hypothetical protein